MTESFLRYLLPKGSVGGQVYQFYVIVYPVAKGVYQENCSYYYPRVGSGARYFAETPVGFPFNRRVDESYFYVPNSYFQDVVIYNKNYEEMNGSY